jgi:concanavalin A-like lectin/glucanase superfamily protein
MLSPKHLALLSLAVLPSLIVSCTGDDNVGGPADAGLPFDAGLPSIDARLPDGQFPLADAAKDVGVDAPSQVDAARPADSGVDASLSDAASDAQVDAPVDAASDAPLDADAALTYPAVVLADAPLSYWRFGESSGTVAVDERSATNGTYHGTVTLGAAGAIVGDSNTAATFDGATAYVDMGAAFAFGGISSMSYEAWVKPDAGDAAARRFMSKETNDGAREGFLMGYSGITPADGGPVMTGVLSWERWGAGGTDSTGAIVTVGSYQHVVVTYDGANMAVYLNGAPVGSTASTRSIKSLTNHFRVATYSDVAAAADCFGGTIDEVAIYDHALSAASVALHYHVGSGL